MIQFENLNIKNASHLRSIFFALLSDKFIGYVIAREVRPRQSHLC